MRAGIRAKRAVGLVPGILDVYGYAPRTDPNHRALIERDELSTLPDGGIRVFHLNGNEVADSVDALSRRGITMGNGYNVIVPAWELCNYPDEWVSALRYFDEVWAISNFTHEVWERNSLPTHYIGQSVEVSLDPFLPRKHFGIRESSFTLLHGFDTTSFPSRKNPFAVIDLYRRLQQARPYADIQLVLKVKTGDAEAVEWASNLRDTVNDAVVISENLSTYASHSLLAACDCFVSLHRSEGFGRSLGEAMWLGKLAFATGWSGNLDFMTEDNSLLVKYTLVPVAEGEYPYSKGQVWAEPDLDHAFFLLQRALDDPGWARAVSRKGQSTVLRTMSHRAVGLRMMERLSAVVGSPQSNGSNGKEPSTRPNMSAPAQRTFAGSRLSAIQR